MMEILFITFMLIFVPLFFGLWLSAICNQGLSVWACNIMGWHLAPRANGGFDGCSFYGECPRCHKHVMQDSQGNWF